MSYKGGSLDKGYQVKGYNLLRTYRVYCYETSSVRVSKYLSYRLIFQFSIDIDGSIYNFIMQNYTTTAFSPSPNKRSNFRSKTKLKELGSTMQSKLKTIPSFYAFVKDFPLDTPEDIVAVVRSLQPTHNNFLQNLQNLRLYKPQLTASFEDSWAQFMYMIKSVVVKLMKRGDKVIEQKENKINALLQLNRELQNKQQQWKQKIEKLQHLRQLQSAQLSMADAELEIVSSQMRDIYKLLQGDMQKVTTYLTKLQKSRETKNQEGSTQIFASLKTLSVLMGSMENEQKQAGENLTNMRELIKAMTKCSKVSTGTQVDQSQLLTQAGAIFNNAQKEMPFQAAEASAINVDKTQGTHLIDKLKFKQHQTQPQNFKAQKHAQKPWTLTPTLLVFLQNMSKNNQSGKVLPWQYTKQVIGLIYQERNNYEAQMAAGGIGNSMSFDEFVIFYFLHKHRIRRLAEVKLLQFIISLKYYSRYWPKAEMFCQLMDVMRYQPLFDNSEGFNYKLDFNTQNFFFAIYKKMVTFTAIQEEGATYVPLQQVKKLLRASLYFTDQVNKSRLLAKLDKDIRVFQKEDHCDFDYAMLLILDQYFTTKKRICNNITRAFSRKFEDNQGFFSIDQMKDLFSEQGHLYRAGEEMQYRFPIASDLQICKLYLYAATSGKNGYDFNVNHFITATQRYGFDAPFPFLHNCSKVRKIKEESKEISKTTENIEVQNKQKIKMKEEKVYQAKIQQKVEMIEGHNLARQRIDIGVKLFSQHFSILKQLNTYVDIFSKTLKQQKNVEVVWKSFDQIKTILQRGCEFMKYPLISKAKQ